MASPAADRADVVAALVAERFPTASEVCTEAHRRPTPLPRPSAAAMAGSDDEVAVARRRRILDDALTVPPARYRSRYAA